MHALLRLVICLIIAWGMIALLVPEFEETLRKHFPPQK